MLLHDLAADTLPPRAVFLAEDVLLLTLPDGAPSGPGAANPLAFAPPYGTVAVTGVDGPHRIAAARFPGGATSGAFARIASQFSKAGLTPPTLGSDASELADAL